MSSEPTCTGVVPGFLRCRCNFVGPQRRRRGELAAGAPRRAPSMGTVTQQEQPAPPRVDLVATISTGANSADFGGGVEPAGALVPTSVVGAAGIARLSE
jgi:hypothetical protein